MHCTANRIGNHWRCMLVDVVRDRYRLCAWQRRYRHTRSQHRLRYDWHLLRRWQRLSRRWQVIRDNISFFVLQNSKISGSRSCGPPLKANGAMCGVGTECSSGICSTSGHCCATACPLCGTCASGSCVATCMTAGGCTNPMCPVITCTGILKGFNAAVCEKYTGSTTTGVCQNVKIISIMSYFEC